MLNSEIPAWKKARCVRCEEGVPLCSDGRTHGSKFDCAAPTEEEYIAELTAERDQLRDDLAAATKALVEVERSLLYMEGGGR